jgi:hypothetical protein
MSNWFAAHLIMYVKLKRPPQSRFTVWENIVLISADSEEAAFAKAEQRGHEEEGDEDGSFRWGGKPATWVFAGVRKVTACQDPDARPKDGTEISYTELQVESEQAVKELVEGQPVAVHYSDQFRS